MKFFTNEQIAAQLDVRTASSAIREAYLDFARGTAAMQPRARTGIADVKFSAMSAMLGRAGIAASKIYTTIDGQFRFYIALLSLEDGALKALMEGDAITATRTAATTVLAAQYLARTTSSSLGLFGSGIQARAHVDAFVEQCDVREVLIHSRDENSARHLAARLKQEFAVDARLVDAQAAASADMVVLATRSSEPVLRGEWLRPGAFVASIGATRPDQRELDDTSLRSASRIVVDWTGQAPFETGDLVLAPEGLLESMPPVDLSSVIAAGETRAARAEDIVIYKAVGVALQDAAVAHLAYTRLLS
ncbi:NAD(P)-binding domain-containing protein [Paraburkholderia sp. C35]|uniref:ornithine cyclodeaminase family protein n=1 Tax=Paraburkholderia sp. C35 TaxID=2126993 RepID=UPI000D686EFD|nr:NAD(P)-binding domain-containing protein [Paraburkholderia sp. C35]